MGRRKKMKKETSSAAAIDRISELPEEIIHVILARLESHESVARTSILSKRWLRIWSTFPFVEFKGNYRSEEIQSKFQSFTAATSKRLLAAVPPLLLDSFTIELLLPGDCEQIRQSLLQLLSSVAGGRFSPIKVVVKIRLITINSSVSAPIEGGMLLNFSRTKFLDLRGFDLSRLHSFELENLQELSLDGVLVSRQSFPIFLANAPRLKILRMERISEIDHTLDISASNFPSSPLLLDSFNLKLPLQNDDNLHKGLYQLLSLVSVGSSSPIKAVVNNYMDTCASLEGGMLLNCGRTKFLDLKGFDISRLHSFETYLDNLQELSLEHIQVSKQSFPSCLANSPRLEKLKLQYILGIDSLDISASNFPSLVSLNFKGCTASAGPYLKQLQLNSDTLLQTLDFLGECKFLKLVSAPNVKALRFSPMGELGCKELEKLMSKFPSLESLYVNAFHISGDNKLRVSSHTLRELTFAQSISKTEFEIDTPNLTTLTISAFRLKINSTVVNVHPSCRCVFDCYMFRDRLTTSWFIELRNCLAALATSFRQLVFKLDIRCSTKVPELNLSLVGHECAPLAVQHLLMGIDFRDFRLPSPFKKAHKTRLFEGLLWTLQPKALSVAMSRFDDSLFSYISKQIETKNLKKCCSNGKCWRHQLKDAKITSVTVHDVATIHKSVISQPSIDMVFLISRGRLQYR